jgi:hypothetical protein
MNNIFCTIILFTFEPVLAAFYVKVTGFLYLLSYLIFFNLSVDTTENES